MKFELLRVIAVLAVSAAISPAAIAQDAAKDDSAETGQALFEKKCGQCHSLAQGKNGNGPSLYGLMNRRAATVAGFKYSRAMRAKANEESLIWTESALSEYLTRPSDLVPGTRMAFPGLKDDEKRAALIEWIKNNSGPAPQGQ